MSIFKGLKRYWIEMQHVAGYIPDNTYVILMFMNGFPIADDVMRELACRHPDWVMEHGGFTVTYDIRTQEYTLERNHA